MHSPSEILAQINGFFNGKSRKKSLDCSEASSEEENESNGIFSGKFRRRSDEVVRSSDRTVRQNGNGAISSAANLVRRAKQDLKLNFKRLSFGDSTPPALPARHFNVEIEDDLPPPIPERKCSLDNVLNEEFQSRFTFHPLSTCPLPQQFTGCKKTYPSQTAKKSRIERPSFEPPPPPPPADTSSSPSPTSPNGKFSLAPPLKENDDVFLDPPWQSNHNSKNNKINGIVKNGLPPKPAGHKVTNQNHDLTPLSLTSVKDSSATNGPEKRDLPETTTNETEFCSAAQLDKLFQTTGFEKSSQKARRSGVVMVTNGDGGTTSPKSTPPSNHAQDGTSPKSPVQPLPAPFMSPSSARPLPPPPLQQAQKKILLNRKTSNQLQADNPQNRETPPLMTFDPDSPGIQRSNDVKRSPNKQKHVDVTQSPLSSRPPRPLPLKPKPIELTQPNGTSTKTSPRAEKQNGSVQSRAPSTQGPKPTTNSIPTQLDNVSYTEDSASSAGRSTAFSSYSSSSSAVTPAFSLPSSTTGSTSLFKPPLPSSSPSASKGTNQSNGTSKPPRPPPPAIFTQSPATSKRLSNASPSPPPPPLPSPPPTPQMSLSQSPLPPPPTPSPTPLANVPSPAPPTTVNTNESHLFVPINPASVSQGTKRPLPPPPPSPPTIDSSIKSKGHSARKTLSNGWGGKEIYDPRDEDGDPYDVLEHTKM